MSKYPFKISILGKSSGANILDHVSQYSGEDQIDSASGIKYNSSTKSNVLWNELCLPNQDSLQLYNELPTFLKIGSKDNNLISSNLRNIYWQNISDLENREDSQYARIIEVVLPNNLSSSYINLAKEYANFLINEGMIVDCSVHTIGKSITDKFTIHNNESIVSKNAKAYFVCSLRNYKDGLFTAKNREWNSKEKLLEMKTKWFDLLDKYNFACENSRKKIKP